MTGRIEGKVAIVTGGGQGVGRGVALALAKEGAAVAVVDRNRATATSVARELCDLGARSVPIECDVAERDQVEAAVGRTIDELGRVDILVNCAQGVRPGVAFVDTTEADMELCYRTGALGTFHFMQACFPQLRERQGVVVNVGSAAGLEGRAGFAAYAAAKEAIRALTRVAAREWGQFQVRVNAISPAAMSPATEAYARDFPDRFQQSLAAIPLGRMGDCEVDIGRAVAALAGPDMRYVTGMTLMVDGGQYVLR
jgi:2-hydroxycyclohexanecarboxyl-CoA dehydrogenase